MRCWHWQAEDSPAYHCAGHFASDQPPPSAPGKAVANDPSPWASHWHGSLAQPLPLSQQVQDLSLPLCNSFKQILTLKEEEKVAREAGRASPHGLVGCVRSHPEMRHCPQQHGYVETEPRGRTPELNL